MYDIHTAVVSKRSKCEARFISWRGLKRSKRFNCSQVSRNCRHTVNFWWVPNLEIQDLNWCLIVYSSQQLKVPLEQILSRKKQRLLKETVIVYDIIFHISTQAQKRATFYRALLRSVSSVVDVKKCIRLLLY